MYWIFNCQAISSGTRVDKPALEDWSEWFICIRWQSAFLFLPWEHCEFNFQHSYISLKLLICAEGAEENAVPERNKNRNTFLKERFLQIWPVRSEEIEKSPKRTENLQKFGKIFRHLEYISEMRSMWLAPHFLIFIVDLYFLKDEQQLEHYRKRATAEVHYGCNIQGDICGGEEGEQEVSRVEQDCAHGVETGIFQT